MVLWGFSCIWLFDLLLLPLGFSLWSFNFCHFNYISYCGYTVVHFVWDWITWTWVPVSFPRLGKPQPLFLQISFLYLSLSLLLLRPLMLILAHLMFSQRSLNLVSFKTLFLFAVLIGWFPLFCLPDHWSILLHHLICCWFLLVYFSVQLLFSSACWLIFGTSIF